MSKQRKRQWYKAAYIDEARQMLETFGGYEDNDWEDITYEWVRNWPVECEWIKPCYGELLNAITAELQSRRDDAQTRLCGG